jgi:PadR family transcriptional regulator, regulatory protein PadR
MGSQGLGSLEQLALLAVLRLGENAYAVSVRDEIRGRTSRSISRGAVYTTLDRLERKGCLRSELGPPTTARGGKAKRMYALEPDGRSALQESLAELRRMARGMDELLEIDAEPA